MKTLPKTLSPFLWFFIRKQKLLFGLVLFFALAWALDQTVWPYLFSILIDKITHFTQDKSQIWSYLAPFLIVWASFWILLEIMFRLQGFLTARLLPQFEANIRMAMFKYVEHHSSEFFANTLSGSISNKMNDMAQSASNIVRLMITLFIPAAVGIAIATAMFTQINYTFAALLSGWSLLHLGICLLGARKISYLSDLQSESRSVLTGKLVDTFSNIINVKLFSRQPYEYVYVKGFQEDQRQKYQTEMIYAEKIKVALGLSSLLIPGLLITFLQIYSWQHNLITIGQFVQIFNTTWNIMMMTWVAGMELPNLFKEIGTAQQALTIIKAKHDIIDIPNAKPISVSQGEIVFDHVHFQYGAETRVFQDLSLTLKAGSKVGLVGFSGSGKTTFVNLLMRFYDINSGEIRIDGQDISKISVQSLRQHISMIPQTPSLFHRTLLENIQYGNLDATMEEIRDAAKHAHCEDFIAKMPLGYQSLLGERGVKLSGGQRQRVAIARAILKNAPILILDEATSALDSLTEKYIQEAFDFLMKGKTTLVIAHRLSTLSNMDRIIVFDHGKIVEDGTHRQLLKNNGHYTRLWQMQAGGFLPDHPTSDLSED